MPATNKALTSELYECTNKNKVNIFKLSRLKFSHELTENQSSKTVGGRLKFSEQTTEYQSIYDLHSFRQMLTEIGYFRHILTEIFLAVYCLVTKSLAIILS